MQQIEERLETVEEMSRRIEEASAVQLVHPSRLEGWWPSLITLFGSEEIMYEKLKVNREVFEDALALVGDVVHPTRGRKSSIRSNREKLFFLLVFMSPGVDVLELLVTNQIRSRDHVVEMVKRVAVLFRNNLVNGCIRYLREVDPETPDSALIVDCTVCRIVRLKQPFREAKVFF